MATVAVERWTRERRREHTRRALIEAAADVFARRGFHGASLDEIAETAGFTRGAIYKHFDDKEDLFLAVNEHFNERTLQAFAEEIAQRPELRWNVPALASIWRRTANESPNLDAALGLEFRLFELRNPAVRERSRAQRRRTRELVARYIEDQSAAMGVSLEIPAATLAHVLLAGADGLSQDAAVDPGEEDLYEPFVRLVVAAMTRQDVSRPVDASSRPDRAAKKGRGAAKDGGTNRAGAARKGSRTKASRR